MAGSSATGKSLEVGDLPGNRKNAFWIGLLIYAASFVLVGVAHRSGGRLRGYWCAFFALCLLIMGSTTKQYEGEL